MAVYWVHHYFALPVIFEHMAMDEEERNPFPSDTQNHQVYEPAPGMWQTKLLILHQLMLLRHKPSTIEDRSSVPR